ncbi:hypothetical protein [Brassicibacter mesophilus]|uniref:hypothetical protein n=1 Tax=Brassicibacter mesophilus TaxID=745119 RepID=UPI003D1EBE3E
MKNTKKLAVKTLVFFLVVFCIIAFIHINENVRVATMQPSPNWSRSFQLTSSSYNRESMVQYSDKGYIVFVSPSKDGAGELIVSKLDTEFNRIEEYEVEMPEFNFNNIYSDDIIFKNNEIYWRNYKDNNLYLAKFDEDYRNITSTKIMEDVNSFYVEGDKNRSYLVIAKLDGSIELFTRETDIFTKIASPGDLKSVNKVKLLQYNNKLYLQSIVQADDTYQKSVYITEYTDNKWGSSLFLNSVNEFRNKIKDIDIAVDNTHVYSLVTTQGDEKYQYTYIIDGYNHENNKQFNTLELAWATDIKVYNFSSEPVLISSKDEGIEIFTTAPSNLDTRASNSNVLKMLLTPDGLKNAVLVSNTNKWSSHVGLIDIDNSRYVFWNEAGGFNNTAVKGASDKASIIEKSTAPKKDDIKLALGEEVPALSHLIILCFGARFFNLLPALIWLLCIFFFNEKVENKYYVVLFIGLVIYLGTVLSTMDFYYNYKSIAIMPQILRFSGAQYIIPVILTILGSIFAFIYKNEKEYPEAYKVYAMYILFNHILINYLYAPYLF